MKCKTLKNFCEICIFPLMLLQPEFNSLAAMLLSYPCPFIRLLTNFATSNSYANFMAFDPVQPINIYTQQIAVSLHSSHKTYHKHMLHTNALPPVLIAKQPKQ